MSERLPLLCATNAGLVFATAVLWHSVRHRAPQAAFDVVCFLDDDVPDDEAAALQQFGSDTLGFGVRLVRMRDLPPRSRRRLNDMTQGRRAVWRPALARLVLPDLLGDDVPRALYLDVDAIAVDDVSTAAALDLGGAAVGAVQAPLAAFRGRVGADPYLNSGVLLMDLAAWRAHDIGGRCAEWVVGNRGRSQMADQDALNVVLNPQDGDPRWHPLDPGWNLLTPLYLPRGPILYDVPDRVFVLHFAGSAKPWRQADHPFAELYAEHLRAVPLRPLTRA